MSSDAKAWKEGKWWHGIHDGECGGHQPALELDELLAAVATCYGHPLYWEIRRYPARVDGLVGYSYPRE